MAILRKANFDYEAEANRHMCEGCNKASLIRHIQITPNDIRMGCQCTMYAIRKAPSLYVKANECPHNYRRRKIGGKVRIGQGKGRSGGNL